MSDPIPENLNPLHYWELKTSGISDEIISKYFYSLSGQAAQDYLIQPAVDELGAHANQYVTGSLKRLLDQSEHAKAGGWVCSANGTFKPNEPRQATAKQEDGSYLPVFNRDSSPKLIKYESIREKPYRGAFVGLMRPDGEPVRLADGSIAVACPEGGKKAAATASVGYLSIPFASVTLTTYTEGLAAPEVLPVVKELLADESESYTFVVAFDADKKKNTRQNVARETLKFAEAIERKGGNVLIASWKHKDGKGIDDVLVNKGDAFVHDAIAKALPIKEWKASLPKGILKKDRPAGYAVELKRIEAMHAKYLAKPAADVVLNQRYLDKGKLGTPGSVELLDSPTETGKTSSYLAGLIEQQRRDYPDAIGISSAYRNILLRQSGEAMGFTHWLDTDGDPSLSKFGYLSACPESLTKLASQAIPDGSILLIDEIIAWLGHVFCSDTMKNGADRVAVLKAIKTLFWKVLGGGGYVIGVEANIPQWAVDCLRELLPEGTPINLVRNEVEKKVNQTAYFYDKLTGFKSELRTMALKGVKMCLPSDSANQIDLQYRKMFSPLSSFFISAQNSADKDAQEFATDPKAWLLKNPHITQLGFSPTIGAGTSIDDVKDEETKKTTHQFFDAVAGSFTHLTSSNAAQQLARYRTPVPLHIYCQKSANGIGDGDLSIFDPDKLLARWRDDASYCHSLVNISEYLAQFSDDGLASVLERSLKGEIGEVALIDKWRSIITAIDNFDKLHLKKNLQAKLKADGYINVEVETSSNKGEAQEFRDLKEEAELESGAEFAAVQVPEDMSPDDARSIMSSHGHSRQEILQARKCLYQFEFPNCDFNNSEFNTKWLVKNRGKKLSQLRAEWAARNPEQAKAIDRWHLKGRLKQAKNLATGVSMADISQMSPAADVFAKANLPGAIDAIGSELYGNDHPEVVRVANWVEGNKPLLSKVFRMKFNEERSNLDIFNAFTRKLGYEPKAEKKGGKGRQREKLYSLSDFANPDRGHMLKSLGDKFIAKLEQKGEQLGGKALSDKPDWGVSADELKARKVEPLAEPKPIESKPVSAIVPKVSKNKAWDWQLFEVDLIEAQTLSDLKRAKARTPENLRRQVMSAWEKDGRLDWLKSKAEALAS